MRETQSKVRGIQVECQIWQYLLEQRGNSQQSCKNIIEVNKLSVR
jgi:hypothetical protein